MFSLFNYKKCPHSVSGFSLLFGSNEALLAFVGPSAAACLPQPLPLPPFGRASGQKLQQHIVEKLIAILSC